MTHDASQEHDRQEEAFAETYGDIIKENARIVEAYDARYGMTPNADWDAIGAFNRYTVVTGGIQLLSGDYLTSLRWLSETCVHLRVCVQDDVVPHSYAVVDTGQARINLKTNANKPKVSLSGERLRATIDTHSGNISLYYDEVWVTTLAELGIMAKGGARIAHQMRDDEASYGTGARTFGINLRGRSVSLWNTDPGAYYRTTEPINYCIPLYLGVRDDMVYGVLWDNPSRARVDIGASDADWVRFEAEGGILDVYLFVGDSVEQVLAQYTALTGRMPMPPLWALGYHQSRYSYMTQDEVLAIAQTFREREIACDVLYLDIHYMAGYRVFTWDKGAFPDMAGMIEALHRQGFKLVPILDPGVKVDPDYFGYQNGMLDGVFVTYPDGEVASGVVWPGLTHLPDFTSGRVRQWWAEQLGALLATGIDGIWNDMNEPLFFGEDEITGLPDYAHHDNEGQGGNHRDLHNVYGMLMASASREALARARPEHRQFCITRAGYAGAQRIASSWTGDNRSSWDHLRLSLSITLNMALSGQSFTGADVGGFADDTTPELLARWTQAGSLLPFFRNHSAVDTIHQEPWLFGETIEAICRDAIQLRYDLMPYLYTAFAVCHFDGTPIVKPLLCAEPETGHLRQVDDCYLVGERLLVAPIVEEGSIRRNVYLPRGEWYDYWTHERLSGGGFVTVDAPLDHLPLFVKAGTVLPKWSGLKNLDKMPQVMQLWIFSGEGEHRIYQDAGDGLAYQAGAYRWLQLKMTRDGSQVILTMNIDGDWAYDGLFEVIYVGSYASIEVEGGDIEGQILRDGQKVLRLKHFERIVWREV